jgi:uncharacterized protein (DUF433 family)
MDWHEHIQADPRVLAGKPSVKGTRLGVEFLLGLFAEGWSAEQVFASYPTLTPEALRAVFEYAAENVREQPLHRVAAGR